MEYDIAGTPGGPTSQWVTFILEDEKYGIDVMLVKEVLRITDIAPVPGAPNYVLGIINLRGNVVSVVDTRKRFGLPSTEPDDESRIIIIEHNSQVLGLLVDSIAEVADVAKVDIETSPNVSDASSQYIQGVFSKGPSLLILVDVEKILSEDEWAELQEY